MGRLTVTVALSDCTAYALTPTLYAVAAAAFLGKLSLFLQGADNITGQITQVVVIQFV